MALQVPGRLSRITSSLINGMFACTLLVTLVWKILIFYDDTASDFDFDFDFLFIPSIILAIVIVWLLSEFLLTRTRQAAIGHMLLKLKVVSKSGSKISVPRSIWRFVLSFPMYSVVTYFATEGEIGDYYLGFAGLAQIISVLVSWTFNIPTVVDLLSGTRLISSAERRDSAPQSMLPDTNIA